MTTTAPPRPPAGRPAPSAPRQVVMWCALAGVLVVCAVGVLLDARLAVRLFALELAALAVVRLVAAAPGPIGVTARSKPFDVVFLGGAAIAMAYLSFAPNIAPEP